MARAVWLAVAGLLAISLAGCLQPGETVGVEQGDFVRIHYVARYESNGTVVESSVNGTYPEGKDLAGIPFERHLDQQFWVYMWHPSLTENETGRDLLVDVQFRDLDDDGFRESMLQERADVSRQGTNLTQSDRNRTLWDVPGDVLGDPNVMTRGLYDILLEAEIPKEKLNTREGVLLEDRKVSPEDAYGEADPSQIFELDRVGRLLERNLTGRPRERVESRSTNMTNETEEGDVIGYRLFNATEVAATVTHLNASEVDLYLHLDEGTEINHVPRLPGIWNLTIVNVTDSHYQLRKDPDVGGMYFFPSRSGTVRGTVTKVNATHVVFDANDPERGETIVYDVKVINVVSAPEDDRLLRGHTVDPFKVENTLHDVAFLSSGTILAGTEKGIYVTLDFARNFFPYARRPDVDRLIGRSVEAVEVARDEPGGVWLSVEDEGLLWTENSGFNWSEADVGLPDGRVVALSQVPVKTDVLYAVVEGEGVYRSTDHAGSWSKVGGELTDARAVAAGWDAPDTLWAATDTGLQRSTDQGRTWQVAEFRGEAVTDVGVVDNHTIYAVAGGEFNISFDGGTTWEAPGQSPEDLRRVTHALERPQRMVATNATDGIFFSSRSGSLWVPLRR